MPSLQDLLQNVNSLCIAGHVRPDGDCVGSTVGLLLYVQKNFPEIETHLYLEEPSPKLAFLKGFPQIETTYPEHAPFDLMICLDSGSLERIGKAQKYFKEARRTVNIDHHVSNTLFADENYVNGDSSSASEEIYKFMDPDLLDYDMAAALYTGIIYDTGVFKYRSTSPETMRIAARLMEFNLPTDAIIDEFFYAKSYAENRILGYAILNSQLCCDGKVIYSMLSKAQQNEFGVGSRELEGIVAQLRLTEGVICAVFLYETPAGDVKVSLRSEAPFDVNAIAVKFGGGGHVRASGVTMQGTLEECLEQLLAEIEKTI